MILSPSGKFLDTAGTHTECEPGYQTLLAKSAFSLGPKTVQLRSCLKIHPITVFLLMIAIALVKPLGFLKLAGGLQVLVTRSFPLECQLI